MRRNFKNVDHITFFDYHDFYCVDLKKIKKNKFVNYLILSSL